MASKAFLAVAANIGKSKNVETVIIGTEFLGEGTHDVTIQAVDSSKMDDNKLGVTFIGAEGKAFTDNIFTMSQDQSDFSFGLRSLWSALIPNKDAIGSLIAAVAAGDDKAFEVFTGMKLQVTLKPGKGVQARSTSLGKFAGFDVETNEKVTEEYDDIKAVYTEVKARALKRSYLRIVESKATNAEQNIAQYNAARAAQQGASATDSGVVSSNFSAGPSGPKAV